MAFFLNNVTTQDEYSEACTLQCPSTKVVRLNMKVFNNGIYLALSTTPDLISGGQATGEEFYPPGMYSLDRYFAAAAVRSAFGGAAAQVTLSGWLKGEIS